MSRPLRSYDPVLREALIDSRRVAQVASSAFFRAIDEAIAGGMPLREIESITGISRSTLSRATMRGQSIEGVEG